MRSWGGWAWPALETSRQATPRKKSNNMTYFNSRSVVTQTVSKSLRTIAPSSITAVLWGRVQARSPLANKPKRQDGVGIISSASGIVTWKNKTRSSERRDGVAPWGRAHWPRVNLSWTPVVGSAAPSRRAWSWCRNDALVKVSRSRTPWRTTTASDDPRRRSSSDYLISSWLAAGSEVCLFFLLFWKKKHVNSGKQKLRECIHVYF